MIAQQIVNVVKDMVVEDIRIIDFENTDTQEIITVVIDVSLIDYYEIVKDYTELLRRKSDKRVNAKYVIEISRPKVFLTNEVLEENIEIWPNCEAPIDIDNQKYCEYCQTLLVTVGNCYKVKTITVEREIVESDKAEK